MVSDEWSVITQKVAELPRPLRDNLIALISQQVAMVVAMNKELSFHEYDTDRRLSTDGSDTVVRS